MAQIDDTIATYLTAIDVEGKTQNTVLSYRASLEDFRRVGQQLGFPGELEAYSVGPWGANIPSASRMSPLTRSFSRPRLSRLSWNLRWRSPPESCRLVGLG